MVNCRTSQSESSNHDNVCIVLACDRSLSWLRPTLFTLSATHPEGGTALILNDSHRELYSITDGDLRIKLT